MRKVFRSRRRVVVAVVAALAVVGIGSSTASAVTNPAPPSVGVCNGYAYSSNELLLACLAAMARGADFESRDMKVAAPSSVITATGSESPTRRVQEVNRWRPNPQSWVDAKSRVAAGSGLTTADIEATGRWAPKITKVGKLAGPVGAVLTAMDLGWILRDNAVAPMLGLPKDAVNGTYCTKQSVSFALDLLAGLAGADCGDWRLRLEDEAMIEPKEEVTGSVAGATFVGWGTDSQSGYRYACYFAGVTPVSGLLPRPSGHVLVLLAESKTAALVHSTHAIYKSEFLRACGGVGGANYMLLEPDPPSPRLGLRRSSDQVMVEEHGTRLLPRQGGWTSTVRCLDGRSVSEGSGVWPVNQGERVELPPLMGLELNCQPVEVETQLTDGEGNPVGSPVRTEVPTEVQDWMRDFPSCWDGSCLLELKKVVGTGELDCFDAPDQCVDWFTEVQTQPSTYRCYYGGVLVPITECNVYSRVFDREKVQQGTGYADPETGEEVKTGSGTTTTTNPGAARVAMDQPVKDASQTRECWPTGWGVFNPFEWVMKPVQCALEWAFVPRTSKLTQTTTKLQLAATNSRVGQAAQVATTWTAVAESMNPSGCAGPTISLNLMGIEYSGNPLSACAEPAATLAFWSRIIIGITAVLAAVFAVTRYIGRVFGYEGFGRASGGES